MTTTPFPLKAIPLAAAVSIIATWQIHTRAGDESFVCGDGPCTLGSGASWLLTGVAMTAPLVALLGVAWTRRLHLQQRLGPFEDRAIPDGEEIFEVVVVLLAGLATFWLTRNGPMIEAVPGKVGRPNTWVLNAAEWTSDETPTNLVPSRANWFLIGAILGAPFAFSFGSMLARERYRRLRRRTQEAADNEEVIDLNALDKLTVVDLTDSNADLPIDER